MGSYQEYPKEGKLKDNMNLTLSELLNKLRNQQELIYAYVIRTVQYKNNKLLQRGCGPNFEGGLITLCTCKHYMRTWRDVPAWKGMWVAGFTRFNLIDDKKNYLFYLMKVREAFSSHSRIWNFLDCEARTAKNARGNPLGDVYEPRKKIEDEFDYLNYHTPVENHVHATENLWHEDINYTNWYGKRPALLVGDLEHSFLWFLPIIRLEGKHPRTKIWQMKEFKSAIS